MVQSPVGGYVSGWFDFNADGLVTAGDTGITGIVMSLTGTSFDGTAITRTATTNASGGT